MAITDEITQKLIEIFQQKRRKEQKNLISS